MNEIRDGSAQTGGRTLNEAADIIKSGHPPMANKVILCDFDSTIAPFGYLFDFPKPLKGVQKFLSARKKEGYTIAVFTSRLSKSWLESVNQSAEQHIAYIFNYCERYGIPCDFVTAEKIPSEFIFDDKAIRVETWEKVEKEFNRILSERQANEGQGRRQRTWPLRQVFGRTTWRLRG